LLPGSNPRLIEVLADFVDHPTFLEGVKQTEDHGLRQSTAGTDLLEGQSFARCTKGSQQLRGMHDGLDQVSVSGLSGRAHTLGHHDPFFAFCKAKFAIAQSGARVRKWRPLRL